MEFSKLTNEAPDSSSIWDVVIDWAKNCYRARVFDKDELIPVRQGLLYIVDTGVVRLVGTNQVLTNTKQNSVSLIKEDVTNISTRNNKAITNLRETQNSFLGFVTEGEPFETVTDNNLIIRAYAHQEDTRVIWLYWEDLDNWADFRQQIYDRLRHQNQRKLLWLAALGNRKTMDRLICFLGLLIEEYGQPCHEGYFLPYNLTHAQISSSIGATRVTVTRLMGELKRQGYLKVLADNVICLPFAETA